MGQVTLLGAVLRALEPAQRVYALSSHSLPVIRCLESNSDEAEIHIRRSESGLRRLMHLSPLFGKIWNDSPGPLGVEYQDNSARERKCSFELVC